MAKKGLVPGRGGSHAAPMDKLKALWRGDLELAEAFWTWVLFGGLIVNVTTSVLFLVLITLDQAWFALFVGYGCSLPYNLLALVGAWRSAAQYEGPQQHADLARAVSIILLAGLSVT